MDQTEAAPGQAVRALGRGATAAVVLLTCSSSGAIAHHAMEYQAPSSWLEGFLSGLAHPVMGLDHLAFLIGVGCLAAYHARGAVFPAAFILGMLLGLGAYLHGFGFFAPEMAIALSLVALGTIVAAAPHLSFKAILMLLFLGGAWHGQGFAEGIIGAEATPVSGYLLGLVIVQYGVCMGTLMLARQATARWPAQARLGGATAGVFILAAGVFIGLGL